ncbi:hypothetical protein DFAR_2480049 [Desulfarculales bacterium]
MNFTTASLPTPAQPVFDPARQGEYFKPTLLRYADNGLDLSGDFDCFHETSHTANLGIVAEQRVHRALLKTLMEAQGFKNLAEEWCRYTLGDEPYLETDFDFPVE